MKVKITSLSKETQAAIKKEIDASKKTIGEYSLNPEEAVKVLFEEEIITGKEQGLFNKDLFTLFELCDKFKEDFDPRRLGYILDRLDNNVLKYLASAVERTKRSYEPKFKDSEYMKIGAREAFDDARINFTRLLEYKV